MNEKNFNILLTSAGRRGYLVDFFKEALNGCGLVHVSNSSPIAPAFSHADKFVISPLIYDKEYIPFILRYCIDNEIKVVVSLFDIDLMVLSRHKHMFLEYGIHVIVSDENVINICNDKYNTYKFCINNNFCTPKTYLSEMQVMDDINKGNLKFPIVIKPRWGMGSISIYIANCEQELMVLAKKVRNEIFDTYLKYESAQSVADCVLFQEKIQGQEYGLDVIHDLDRNYLNTIVRKKIAMRSGETDVAMVVKDDKIENMGRCLGEKMKHIGNLDVDLFVTDESIYVLEMNARFGGGYPFSHYAGIDLPKAIIKWVKGERLDDELNVKEFNQVFQKDIQLINLTDVL